MATGESSGVVIEELPPEPVKPAVKHQFYETETHVVVSLFIKGTKREEVLTNFTENSMTVDWNDLHWEVKLKHEVVPDQYVLKCLSTKIEIKAKKLSGAHWGKLEREEEKLDVHKYPSSSHYTRSNDHWDKLTNEVKKEEEEEKLDGDQALNKVFQKIYSDGTDEVKKAMMKSFQESGGTVLSTNWKEIGKEKTEVKPPDGMEWKTWQQ
ncbi:unnamed protein product [Dimorphilus gyrociliatus]|uniref:Uncharacterized protein n=1 Tax=Dimorphilus gyrociliatus TaxID=2664684 RepID=A0A7I8VBS7_9ANNE|nr:unnamed protein product [Dimorphilus gyrociliatus]